MQFTIAIKRHADGVQIAAPDLPGCLALGPTVGETRTRIKEAILEYCAALAAQRQPLPAVKPFLQWIRSESGGRCDWNVVDTPVEQLFAS